MLFILSFSLFSQSKDTTAKHILWLVSNKTKSYKSYKIEFLIKFETNKKILKETKEGTVIIKDNKYKLSLDDQIIFNDGKTLWTYLPEQEEVTIQNFKESDKSFTPQKIISGYTKDFTPKLIKEYNENGKNYMTIDLTPIKSQSYYKVRLIINKDQLQIKSSVFYEKDGSKYRYEFNKVTANVTVNDSDFVFNLKDYPRVEVIDMRE